MPVHEYFMGGKVYISPNSGLGNTGAGVSVSWWGAGMERGVAEACLIPSHPKGKSAYVNRVLVQPDSLRGQGIGSHIFDLLLKELKREGFDRVVVEPGGYNMSFEKQAHFYERFGFKKGTDSFFEAHLLDLSGYETPAFVH